MADHIEGQVIEINWRATRIRTGSNDIVVIPNSVISKAIVTNHRRLNEPRLSTLRLKIDQSISPQQVIDLLRTAAGASPGISPGTSPSVSACEFVDALIAYEIYFGVEDFALTGVVQSDMIKRVTQSLHDAGIRIGPAALDVRIVAPQGSGGIPLENPRTSV